MSYKLIFSTKELAELLRVHYISAIRLCREGKIPAVKMGGKWVVVIDEDELKGILKERGIEVSDEEVEGKVLLRVEVVEDEGNKEEVE
jgi:excisionase family DNA binding protein